MQIAVAHDASCYELKEQGDARLATHRVTFEGMLFPVFGRLIASGMKKSLPSALSALKALAEKTKSWLWMYSTAAGCVAVVRGRMGRTGRVGRIARLDVIETA